MPGKAYQSCLKSFENEIIGLRLKRPPVPYSKIAEHLKEKYQIEVCRQAIYQFLKTRSKGYKTCKYAGCIEPINDVNQPTTEVPSLPKQTVLEAQETPTQSVTVKPATPTEPKKVFKMQYSDVYNLTRLSDEEAAERNKRIEEKRRLKEEQLKKENQLKSTEQPQEVEFNMEWSDVYNLTRMSDEEAAACNKRIEEKRKRLNEEKLKKANQ